LRGAAASPHNGGAFLIEILPMRLVRRTLCLFALLAAAAAMHAPAARAHGLAFVLNSAAASISVVDMSKGVEIRRIPVLREPHHLALSPNGRDLLVGDTVGNEMLFLDPASGDVRRRLPVADPYQIGFSPNGKWLTVTGLARNQVDVYDAATMQLAKRFPLASMPSHLAYSPDSSKVYVSLQGTDRLAAIDLDRMAVAWNVPVGKTPAGVMWHAGRVLVADMGANTVEILNPDDGRVERRIVIGRGAHQLFLSPDGKIIYVNARVDGTTTALDAKTLEIERVYAIPGGPDCIDFAPDGKLWITQRWAGHVAVLDPVPGTHEEIAVGRSPHGIFLNARAE